MWLDAKFIRIFVSRECSPSEQAACNTNVHAKWSLSLLGELVIIGMLCWELEVGGRDKHVDSRADPRFVGKLRGKCEA